MKTILKRVHLRHIYIQVLPRSPAGRETHSKITRTDHSVPIRAAMSPVPSLWPMMGNSCIGAEGWRVTEPWEGNPSALIKIKVYAFEPATPLLAIHLWKSKYWYWLGYLLPMVLSWRGGRGCPHRGVSSVFQRMKLVPSRCWWGF